jgi:hypothetical protein
MAYDTVANLVSDAAIELGIAPNASPIVDPYASTDQNIVQLRAAAQEAAVTWPSVATGRTCARSTRSRP